MFHRIRVGAAHLGTDPPHGRPRVPGIHLIFVVAAVARTPWLPVPTPTDLRRGVTPSDDHHR